VNSSKLIRILLLALFLSFINIHANNNLQPQIKLKVGEELNYKVKYSLLTLGSLKFKILDKVTLNNRPVYHCKLFIDSSVPFVAVHDVYESWMDEDVYSHRFYSWEGKGDHTLFTHYEMNYDDNTVHIIEKKITETDTVLVNDSTAVLGTDRKVQDGLTLLFFARAMAKHEKKMSAPIFAFNDLRYTFINFTGEQKKITAKGDKYKAYYLDGWMKFVGIAGIKDGFKGWFSPDSQSIPLKAHMEAFIGHVTIQLDSWENWNPNEEFGEARRTSND
jgi:hypothetical protein